MVLIPPDALVTVSTCEEGGDSCSHTVCVYNIVSVLGSSTTSICAMIDVTSSHPDPGSVIVTWYSYIPLVNIPGSNVELLVPTIVLGN